MPEPTLLLYMLDGTTDPSLSAQLVGLLGERVVESTREAPLDPATLHALAAGPEPVRQWAIRHCGDPSVLDEIWRDFPDSRPALLDNPAFVPPPPDPDTSSLYELLVRRSRYSFSSFTEDARVACARLADDDVVRLVAQLDESWAGAANSVGLAALARAARRAPEVFAAALSAIPSSVRITAHSHAALFILARTNLADVAEPVSDANVPALLGMLTQIGSATLGLAAPHLPSVSRQSYVALWHHPIARRIAVRWQVPEQWWFDVLAESPPYARDASSLCDLITTSSQLTAWLDRFAPLLDTDQPLARRLLERAQAVPALGQDLVERLMAAAAPEPFVCYGFTAAGVHYAAHLPWVLDQAARRQLDVTVLGPGLDHVDADVTAALLDVVPGLAAAVARGDYVGQATAVLAERLIPAGDAALLVVSLLSDTNTLSEVIRAVKDMAALPG